MTTKELERIEEFLIDMNEADDKIDILENIYCWIRNIYHTQGKERLDTYNKNL